MRVQERRREGAIGTHDLSSSRTDPNDGDRRPPSSRTTTTTTGAGLSSTMSPNVIVVTAWGRRFNPGVGFLPAVTGGSSRPRAPLAAAQSLTQSAAYVNRGCPRPSKRSMKDSYRNLSVSSLRTTDVWSSVSGGMPARASYQIAPRGCVCIRACQTIAVSGSEVRDFRPQIPSREGQPCRSATGAAPAFHASLLPSTAWV